MVSVNQLRANRANAKNSTGPRVQQASSNSSLNAIKHGLSAETIEGK